MDDGDRRNPPADALVIGSGPAGLSCARELAGRGVAVTVLERGESVGSAWTGRYDALRFNTSRRHSALPEAPFPREFGQFPTRDQYVEYLRGYRERHGIDVRLRTAVTRIDPHRSGTGWTLACSDGTRWARHVVVATGSHGHPVIPDWPGRDAFAGTLLHSAEYRNPHGFDGRDVLVVGAGSSGMEIAQDLVAGRAARVRMSVRTPPNMLLRSVGGMPSDVPLPVLLRLPVPWADAMARFLRRVTIGDLSPYGLPVPAEGPFSLLRRTGASLSAVDRPVLDSIRSGAITVVAAVRALHERGAVLADGTAIDVDAVVAATGYTTGLEPLVGHLGVLDARGYPHRRLGEEVLPGLRFVGFVARPGLPRYVGVLARRAAREIATGAVTDDRAALAR